MYSINKQLWFSINNVKKKEKISPIHKDFLGHKHKTKRYPKTNFKGLTSLSMYVPRKKYAKRLFP